MKKDRSVKWYVTYDGYNTGSGVTIVLAKSPEEALIKIIKKHGYGFDEEDQPSKMSGKELLDLFRSQNGDGCDFVISIISDKGKIFYVTAEQDKPEII